VAVAVGSFHAQTTRDTKLDIELVGQIVAMFPIPLVLHGSSGANDSETQAVMRAGMKKMNIATHLNHPFTDAVRESLATDVKTADPRKYFTNAREVVATETTPLIEVLALD